MFSLLLAASLQFTGANAKIALETTSNLVEKCTPRDAGSIRGRIAANYLLDAASEAGADVRQDVFEATTPLGVRRFTNLYAKFKTNPTNRWVVLVSHYDTKSGINCPGANDGASTSGLLVALAGMLADCRQPSGNVLLVWTDGEECMGEYGEHDGLHGSRRAAERIKASGMPVQAVICLDMLGDRDLHVTIPKNGSEKLAKIAVHAARRINEPNLVSFATETVTDDHVPFLDQGFAAIDLIDFNYGDGNCHWHSDSDTMENVSEASLLKSGRLVTEMLNILL